MKNTLTKLLLISRPISWLNTAYPFAVTYLIIQPQALIHPFFYITTFFFLFPYNLLMYGINDIFDYESDIRNPRKGGIEGAVEQKQFHPIIWTGVLVTTIPFLAYLLFVGNLFSSVCLLILIFFVVAYSLKGLRFKEIPVLDSITSSIHFVGPAVYGASFLGIIAFHHSLALYLIAFFLWGMASHAFGAIQDIIPDREGKLHSIATVFGARATVWLVVSLYTMSCVLLFTQGILASLCGVAGISYIINTLPYVKISDTTSEKTNKGWRRFIWLNYGVGFIVTLCLLIHFLYHV